MIEFILSFVFSINTEFNPPERLSPDRTGTPTLSIVKRPYCQSQGSFIFAGNISRIPFDAPTLFGSELEIYPLPLLRHANISSIIGSGTIYLRSKNQLMRVGGFAGLLEGCIWLDLGYGTYSLRHSIHHELYHFIDHRSGLQIHDPEWESLNDPGFRYSHDHSEIANGHDAGFVSSYATCDAGEDKAETFAWMISAPAMLEKRIITDQILLRKINCLKRRLQTICPEMNESFWTRIAKRSDELRAEKDRQPRAQLMMSLHWVEAMLRQTFVDQKLANNSPLTSLAPPLKYALMLLAFATPLFVVVGFRSRQKHRTTTA